MDSLARMHEELSSPHAFSCEQTYREAYAEAVRDGYDPGLARNRAEYKHDQAVEWVYANVSLD